MRFTSSLLPWLAVYSSEDRLYCYPSSSTLKNLFGILDATQLAETEAYVVALRMAEILREPTDFVFSFGFLKDLHRLIFRDIYAWAGNTRRVDMSKGDTRFAVWEQIESEAEKVFLSTEIDVTLFPDDLRNGFLDAAAQFLVELNVVHPFREGNGRVIRLFAELWAKSVGFRLAWDRVEPEQFINAMIHGVVHDAALAREVLDACLVDTVLHPGSQLR